MAGIAPLQLYCSGLAFAPAQSVIKGTFLSEIPKQIQRLPKVIDSWSTTLQTLEGHSHWVTSLAFSPDGLTLASGSGDHTNLWDTATGTQRQTLEGHSDSVESVAFSPDELTPALAKAPSNFQISLSSNWVSLGGENFLWLPAEYRSFVCLAVKDATLALGYMNGRVLITTFHTHIV